MPRRAGQGIRALTGHVCVLATCTLHTSDSLIHGVPMDGATCLFKALKTLLNAGSIPSDGYFQCRGAECC